MDVKIKVRDNRNPGWYYINNEVYDSAPSCEALAIYNAIARYANNDTQNAYFSGKKWKRHHKVGHSKLAQGLRWLLDMKLIAPTGQKTAMGALYFDLLSTEHLKKPEQGGVLPQNRGVFQGETGGCSEVEQGGVLPQNTNYTRNKTRKPNKKTNAAKAPPALQRRLTDLIGEAHKALTGSDLVWQGKGKQYGQAMKDIIKILEPLADDEARYQELRNKCAAFFSEAKKDEFYKKQGITPSSILMNWNKLHYKKSGTDFGAQPQKPFPKYQNMNRAELEEAFHDWSAVWDLMTLKKNISPDSFSRFINERGQYAPALVDVLEQENRERNQQKIA